MSNTLLFYDRESGNFGYYRTWDSGKGSLTVECSSLEALVADMKRSVNLFGEPFMPESGIPEVDYGNKNMSAIRPLSEVELGEVIMALNN